MKESSKDKEKINHQTLKLVIYAILVVLLSGFFGYEIVSIGADLNLSRLSLLVVFLLAWLSFAALIPFFVENKIAAVAIAFFQAAAVWFFLPNKFSLFPLAAGAVLFIFLILAYFKGRQELRDYLRVKFLKISKRSSRVALTGVMLFIVILFVGSFNFPALDIPKSTFNFFIQGSGPVVRNFIPNFTKESKVQETLEEFTKGNLPLGTPGPVIRKAAENLRKELSRLGGAVIKPEASVLDSAYQIAIFQFRGLSRPIKASAVLVIALIAFSILKGLAFFLNWIIIIVGFLIYQLLLAFKFMKLSYESVNKEIIIA